MTMNYSPSTAFSLTEALESEIPSLVRIHIAAFALDNSSRLMFKDNATRERKLQEMLQAQISDPNYAVIKAVGKDTDKIFGWLGCGWIGYAKSQRKDNPAKIDELGKPQVKGESSLQEVLRKDFTKVQSEWMAGKKYIHIGTLVTDPAHQGKGVGTALVHWATSRADDSHIPCWLQSSPVAHPMYYRAGFRNVGSLEIDLREFVLGAKGGKWGWGPFEFRYMLRLPEDRDKL